MFQVVKKLISPDEARQAVALPKSLKKVKEVRDDSIKDIIAGRDDRLLLIVGPCSADKESAVLDYVSRLSKLADKVKDKLFIVPRIYTNKPRTRGEGYKGMLHDPDNSGDTDIQAGILSLRRLHIRAIEESGLSAADEMLYPDNVPYVEDILSYVAVGARSSENQQHRLVASGFDVAVGIKNPMNGSFPVLLNSIHAAQIANEFKYNDAQVRTNGNPYAHAILRGSVDVYGNNLPNYHYEDTVRLLDMYMAESTLVNPAALIDVNHSNSNKNPFEQIRIVKEVEGNRRHNEQLRRFIKGYLIESYIEDGNQSVGGTVYGKSVTDACLGWDKTERLILETAERL